MSGYLERAALHQTRFRTPGVSPDARGVVLGQRGALLFPSIDRVVAFFRAYGEDGSLDELLPTLSIQRVTTPLRTRELLVLVGADSSYRMDRIAAVARLAGGLVFTGTSRHFVKYRDAASPLGYDVAQLLDQPADVIVYDEAFQQLYTFERELSFRDLVLKLEPYRVPPAAESSPSSTLWVTAPIGIGHALIGYFFRWRVGARVALVEWPSQSAFDDTPVRAHVFELTQPPPRIVALLRSLPGVHVFEPLGGTFGVEVGFRHPIALESCASLFAGAGLTLFRGDGQVTIVDPRPPFAEVRTLVRSNLSLDGPSAGQAKVLASGPSPIALELRLAPTQGPWRRVVATVVPLAQADWLAKLLYVLPEQTLSALRVAITGHAIHVIDPAGIQGVPVGRFYSEVAPRIYVPSGMTLVPAVAPSVLADLLVGRAGGHAFFVEGHSEPYVVPEEAFGPVSRRMLRELRGPHVEATAPERDDPPLPQLRYEDEAVFPLWGVPARRPTTRGPQGAGGA